jgi:hypothetical protein
MTTLFNAKFVYSNEESNLLGEINFGPSRSVTLTNYSDYQFEKCQCLK